MVLANDSVWYVPVVVCCHQIKIPGIEGY